MNNEYFEALADVLDLLDEYNNGNQIPLLKRLVELLDKESLVEDLNKTICLLDSKLNDLSFELASLKQDSNDKENKEELPF